MARFDLELGKILSGFTFNFGDSPSNNAYGTPLFSFFFVNKFILLNESILFTTKKGGDSGSTSNSAEMHSNDNRFYVWLVKKTQNSVLNFQEWEYKILLYF